MCTVQTSTVVLDVLFCFIFLWELLSGLYEVKMGWIHAPSPIEQ